MNVRVRRGLEVLSLAPVVLLLLVVVAPDSLSRIPSRRTESFLAPSWYESTSEDFESSLGTDYLGRPFLPVLCLAVSNTSRFALLGTSLVLAGCIFLGILQGSIRSHGLEALLSASSLGVMAVPEAAVLITVATAWPRTSPALRVNASMLAVLILFAVPAGARLIAERVRSLRRTGFVAASHAYGASPFYTFRHDIWPHLLEDIAWIVASVLPRFIAIEVGLAYLGVEYRDFEGLGRTLTKSFNNLGVGTAVFQMLATIIVIVGLALLPQIVFRVLGLSHLRGTLP